LFSATMPKSIADLASSFLNKAVMVDVSPEEITVERIAQKIMFVRKADKRRLIVDIIKEEDVYRGIVFTRTKHGANRLVKQLDQAGINAAAIHGNKSQGARTKALANFKNGTTLILVATDIASRGIDVDDISHVFNYDLPNEPESYVHRIGRTARAGKSGIAYGFCDESESGYLVGIERLIGFEVPRDEEHQYHYPAAIPKPGQKPGKIKDGKSSGGRSNNSRNRNSRPNNSGGGGRNSRPNRGGGGNQGSGRSRGQGNRGSGGNQGSGRSRDR
jgi:ATP-dependent RNA helicase RhlE